MQKEMMEQAEAEAVAFTKYEQEQTEGYYALKTV